MSDSNVVEITVEFDSEVWANSDASGRQVLLDSLIDRINEIVYVSQVNVNPEITSASNEDLALLAAAVYAEQRNRMSANLKPIGGW